MRIVSSYTPVEREKISERRDTYTTEESPGKKCVVAEKLHEGLLLVVACAGWDITVDRRGYCVLCGDHDDG